MTTLELVVANARRRPARAAFTILTVVVAFVLFGLLLPLNRVFNSGVEFTDARRLIVTNKASILRPLPQTYKERLAKLDYVDMVAHFTFFGAFYREPSNQVAAIVTEPDKFAAIVDEVHFSNPADLEHWRSDPTGIAVGRQLATKYGWSVGDLVPVYSVIYSREDGSPVWTFRVDAIFDALRKDGNTNSMVINYSYFDEARAFGKGTVGWYMVRLRDSRSAAAAGQAIDELFANSPDETETSTEKAFIEGFLRQVGDFGFMITAALIAVFFTLTLVTATTMAQSVRESFSHIAVLKTLGFSDLRVLGLILSEALLITVGGGLLGLLIAAVAIPLIAGSNDQLLSTLTFRWTDAAYGVSLMVLMGVVAALGPGLRTIRLNIVDALGEAV